jgi:hypothetical protein
MARVFNYNHHRRAQTELLQSNKSMAKPPKKFDPDRTYRVMLAYPVPAHPDHPHGHHLRPSDRVTVSGAFAETIRDAIISSVLLG